MVNQSGATYAWSPSAGLSATNIPNPIASPSATTNYVLTVTSADGCVSTDSVLVTVNDSITVDAGSDVTICEGSALSLTGAGSESIYAWSGPDGYSSSDLNPSVSTNATTAMGGNYVLSMTDTAGCVATDTVSVTVTPLPTVDLGDDTTSICQGDSVLLDAGAGHTNYLWSTGDTTQTIYASASWNLQRYSREWDSS